ncbi:MAG: hypothetical protein M1812_002118 [Candelaria pacifica]|nr:MAG: hypothetical protein M1812_002118 [Candelaria pacifica]
MLYTALATTLTLFLTLPISTFAVSYNPWQLSPLNTHSSSGRPGNDPNTTISFTFTDPNTATSSTCSASFLPYNGNQTDFPTDYQKCSTSADPNNYSFAFKIDRFAGIGDFGLTLEHGYRDPAVGTPDFVTAFGSVNVTRSDNFVCEYGGSGVGNCGIVEQGGMPISVPIMELIA